MTNLFSPAVERIGAYTGMRFRGLAAAFLMVAAPVVFAAPAKSACELFTLPEIAKVAGAAVTIKQDESGPDENGGDNCVWTTADRRNVMVRIIALANEKVAPQRYAGELVSAYGRARPPEVLTGLGDEAKYRTYDGNLKGGVVLGRKGKVVFVVEGIANRENLIDLTRTLLSRL